MHWKVSPPNLTIYLLTFCCKFMLTYHCTMIYTNLKSNATSNLICRLRYYIFVLEIGSYLSLSTIFVFVLFQTFLSSYHSWLGEERNLQMRRSSEALNQYRCVSVSKTFFFFRREKIKTTIYSLEKNLGTFSLLTFIKMNSCQTFWHKLQGKGHRSCPNC